MAHINKRFILDNKADYQSNDDSPGTSFLDQDNSIYQEDSFEDDDEVEEEEESINDVSSYQEEQFDQSKSVYNANTYTDFPDMNLLKFKVPNLSPIPKDYKFNSIQQYQEIMKNLEIESFFSELRSIEKNLKQQSNVDQKKQQSIFPQFQWIKNFTVDSVNFDKHGLTLHIQMTQKVLKYQKEQWEIKNNQLMIFQHKQSQIAFAGKTIVKEQLGDDEIERRAHLQSDNYFKIFKQIYKMVDNPDEETCVQNKELQKFMDRQNEQFKQVEFTQIFKIRMNVKEDLTQFLKDINEIEQNYQLLTPNEYYLPLQKIQNSQFQFNQLNFVAFKEQTIDGQKGEIVFPCYEFIEDKSVSENNYKKFLQNKINGITELDKYQKQALFNALHNQNSLIQGPPGTGKTFLAAFLVKFMIKAKEKYCKKPILVLSKKNHSLDQLLRKIKEQYTDVKLLRLGYMSKDEMINKYFTVKELKGPQKIMKYYKQSYKFINDMVQEFINCEDEEEKEDKIDSIKRQMENYNTIYLNSQIIQERKYLQKLSNFMSEFEVIGMTLTGYHTHFEAIRQLKPEIVIVEEASEILESEFYPILTPWLKHLIQFGDHMQLRPFLRSKVLEEVYNYKMSYFERLVTVNQIDLTTLFLQRRMRPQFADFTRLFYGEQYKDADSAVGLTFISEISSNGMYLLPHTYPDQMMRDRSYVNQYEAMFIYFLAIWLQQKCKLKSISILSMYKSQKILIQNKLAGIPSIQSYTVDEFQGNEDDIIILSCVRSNIQNKCGFIKQSHRINVAFSRARRGFFCIGNFYMFQMNIPIWKQISKLASRYMIYGGNNQTTLYKRIHKLTIAQLEKNKKKKGIDQEEHCNMCSKSSHIGGCQPNQDQGLIVNFTQKQNPHDILKSIENEQLRQEILDTCNILSFLNSQKKSALAQK